MHKLNAGIAQIKLERLELRNKRYLMFLLSPE